MDVKQVVEKWKEAVCEGQMDAFSALYAPDARLLVPISPEPMIGREAVKQYESSVSAAFPGATLKLLRTIAQDSVAAVEWEYSGTNTGPLTTPTGEQPPTNRSMSLHGVSILQFTGEGLIGQEFRCYDTKSLFQQLGLE